MLGPETAGSQHVLGRCILAQGSAPEPWAAHSLAAGSLWGPGVLCCSLVLPPALVPLEHPSSDLFQHLFPQQPYDKKEASLHRAHLRQPGTPTAHFKSDLLLNPETALHRLLKSCQCLPFPQAAASYNGRCAWYTTTHYAPAARNYATCPCFSCKRIPSFLTSEPSLLQPPLPRTPPF